MLTRLKVSGFKNLVDVDIRFGPFTCIAGANGVGKSNLFDAMMFLSALANDKTLIEAAKSVREGRTADVRSLFHRVGEHYDDTISFVAEMLIPSEGIDDLGQEAKATITFLKYSLELALRTDPDRPSLGGLELRKEELVHINLGDAKKNLLFPHNPAWRKSAVKGRRTVSFISTDQEDKGSVIRLHQDRGDESGGGRPAARLAANLPRTVLSSANAVEHRTALLARREMQSWRLLQLEPSALREPDEFTAPTRIGSSGSHLAATLHHLAGESARPKDDDAKSPTRNNDVYARIANRLAELIDDVREVGIDVDKQRELLTLFAKGKDGTKHSARALSDGTLRFLALAVLDADPSAQGVLCLEEPENGIHPERIPAMLNLLQDIATDPQEPVGPDNPLRQVIVNTHSPIVVTEVPDDSLVVAELKETVRDGQRFHRVCFSCLPDTWRATSTGEVGLPSIVARGKLLAYLNPVLKSTPEQECNGHSSRNGVGVSARKRRIVDRPDFQRLLDFPDDPS